MCRGERLIADFVAGTDARPVVPGEIEEHLTPTASGLWVVWAYKLAWQEGDLFFALTGGPGYPADATARCRKRGVHSAPDPGCTCGFHALSSRRLPGLPRHGAFAALTVALSGRVLAFEWAGGGILWRAERQTVVCVGQSSSLHGTVQDSHERFSLDASSGQRRRPGDPDGRPAVVSPVQPHDSGPIRLDLPVTSPVLLVCDDDAGWCAVSGALEHAPRSLVLA
jgi:hypothetical protein